MTISTIKSILNRKFAGANIDDIQGIDDFTLFKEAADNLLLEINPAETVRNGTIEVFKDVYDYASLSDLKELVDTRSQSSHRNSSDNPTRRYSEDFDQRKANNNDDFSLEYRDGTRLLRYAKSINGGNVELHNMDSLTSNGTWSGTASNIEAQTHNPYKGSASIEADFDTGEYIENSGFTAVDLSDHKNKSTIFLPAYFPDASLVTSISLRWGSSASAYFSRTKTAPQFGSFKTGWNLIPFAWNGATETGTVDTENIDYLRITYTGSSDTDIKFDNIFSALGEIRDFLYYSKYIFRLSSSGLWTDLPTSVDDILVLDNTTENLFVYECIRLAALQLQGQESIYTAYTNELYGTGQKIGKYDMYKKRNPDEMIQPQTQHRNFGYYKK